MDPTPCTHNANKNVIKLAECKNAKNTITIAMDIIVDNLRLLENL